MNKTLFASNLLLLNALLIFGVAYAEDWQLHPYIEKQDISETIEFSPMEPKDTNVSVSIHHTGSTIHSGDTFLSFDLVRLKREVKRELFLEHTSANPTSPNVVTIFKLVVYEFAYFKGLRSLWDGIETEVENCRRKYKLKGEVSLADHYRTEISDSTNHYLEDTLRGTSQKENSISNFLPKRISWHFSSDLDSNYLKGEIKLGDHFVIEGNWGSNSDVKAMFTFPL